ncbi:MAG TPA: hypothetical protein VFB43_15755 [Terracidiphilus sp.]|jgi:hypothetical protein|nr:hypothetical protein [Terracidiphilus sp.]
MSTPKGEGALIARPLGFAYQDGSSQMLQSSLVQFTIRRIRLYTYH